MHSNVRDLAVHKAIYAAMYMAMYAVVSTAAYRSRSGVDSRVDCGVYNTKKGLNEGCMTSQTSQPGFV